MYDTHGPEIDLLDQVTWQPDDTKAVGAQSYLWSNRYPYDVTGPPATAMTEAGVTYTGSEIEP